ncbi:MAG: hypothetical protein M0004_13065 [Actinomycetota bacterium]|nr:hypothetical protein [Actinomycetota bacterium]
MQPYLVVEPAPEQSSSWRFGRVASERDALGEVHGVLERRHDGEFVLIGRHADAITAMLLLHQTDDPSRRIVYLFPGGTDDEAVAHHLSATKRPSRSTAGCGKAGAGEAVAARTVRVQSPQATTPM